ncbi:MAG: winged helix-turn-helix transcriptional regulator [Candidatus Thermoplasmatota archaeon]
MKILRDLRLNTKLLILLQIIVNPHIKLKVIAKRLDITVQAVSEYLKRMQEEKLVKNIDGEYRATTKGVELLHKHFLELKDFVDSTIKNLSLVEVCTAIAKTPIKKGTRVGLFMEGGVLVGYANKPSSSSGIAITEAKPEEEVAIGHLEGIVELSLGKLYCVELPSVKNAKAIAVSEIREKGLKFKECKIAALDITGLVTIKKMRLKCDFEFAPVNAAVDAIQKGLNVIAFGTSENVGELISTVDKLNARAIDKIKYKVISFV